MTLHNRPRFVPKHFSRFISEGIWRDTFVPHWIALGGFLLFTLAIALSGWQIFEHQKQRIKIEKTSELEAIAELKVQRLVQWREEKMWDAKLVRNNHILARQVGDWIARGMPRDSIYEKLVTRMADQRKAQRLHAMLLFSTEYELLLRSGEKKVSRSHVDVHREDFRQATSILLNRQESYFANICTGHGTKDSHPHLDHYVPLVASRGEGDLETTAIMVFRDDPSRFLLPIVESWPTASRTAESVLLRAGETEIITLSGRRHAVQISERHLRAQDDVVSPARLVLSNQQGVLEHVDYRGVPVLAVVRKITGSPWFLVAKIDIAEIYAPIFELSRNILLIVLAFIFSTGVTAYHWWRKMRASYLAGHYQTELQRQMLEQRFDALTQYANDIILLVNAEGRVVEVNDRAVEAFGLSRESLLTLDISDLRPARDKEVSIEQRQRLVKEGSLLFEANFLRRDGSDFPVEVSARLIELGGEWFFQGILRDITERKKAEEKIQFLAHHDALTGLPNRALLNDRLGQSLARANRYGSRVAILFLDFDRFKNINDSLGHTVGDGVLRAVADRLKSCVREGDTVARLGGDEFVIVLPDLREAECVAPIAEKILQLGAEPYVVDDHQLRVTISIGLSVYPEDGHDIDTLLKNADTAMYFAKENGRDSYHFYTQDMNSRALDILQMESCLQRALANDEFSLCYQPQISFATGKIVGAEALLRWHHPEMGTVPPDQFIPLAEDRGLIGAIGDWVLETACRQNRSWQQEGLRPILLAVNISARQLHQLDFADRLAHVLAETGMAPELLELELTESVVMRDAEQMVELLTVLKSMGLTLSIDDFGTGYSSLSYLKKFPIDRLKIDRSFVQDLAQNPEEAAITRAIIGMGQTLKLRTIAEGVETEEQLRFLQREGCDEFQGFFSGKPLPADEFARMLREDRHLLP